MLAPLQPDLIISGGFPWRIPADVLALPRLGAINLHDALLPRYRGPSAVEWAFRNGRRETGMTIHRLTPEFDTGPILAQARIPISRRRRHRLAPGKFDPMVPASSAGPGTRRAGRAGEPQDESQATDAGLFDDAWRVIDWSRPARKIHNQVRSWVGLRDIPAGRSGTSTARRLQITKTRLLPERGSLRASPGTVLWRDGERLVVHSGDGPIEIVAWSRPGATPGRSTSERQPASAEVRRVKTLIVTRKTDMTANATPSSIRSRIEIIKEGLNAIGDEMFVSLQRTSKSPIIYEVLDYCCGITDELGQLLAQGNGVGGFLGTMAFAVQSTVEKFWPGRLEEGDIIVTNDPYGGGGTHLSDVSLVMPIFVEGELVGFSANKAHWTEVGGKDPGSWTTDSIDIWQEGLQFPCVKLFSRGEPIQSVIDIIEANVRTPDMTLGDVWAQVASCRLGAIRFQELCRKLRRRHGAAGDQGAARLRRGDGAAGAGEAAARASTRPRTGSTTTASRRIRSTAR